MKEPKKVQKLGLSVIKIDTLRKNIHNYNKGNNTDLKSISEKEISSICLFQTLNHQLQILIIYYTIIYYRLIKLHNIFLF